MIADSCSPSNKGRGVIKENHPVSETLTPLLRKEGSFFPHSQVLLIYLIKGKLSQVSKSFRFPQNRIPGGFSG
jgi:hypothetical protein